LEIIAPKQEYEHWRQIVAKKTGEYNGMAQGAVLRSACVNLRDAYDSKAYQDFLKRQRGETSEAA
jgi:hypothetical protein